MSVLTPVMDALNASLAIITVRNCKRRRRTRIRKNENKSLAIPGQMNEFGQESASLINLKAQMQAVLRASAIRSDQQQQQQQQGSNKKMMTLPETNYDLHISPLTIQVCHF